MGIQEAIRNAQAALEALQAGTYEIILRSTPTTWEELRDTLEEYLIPILKRLYEPIGGLMNIPEINLPDGVTSTSLVSQSEMVQFVTNTLDVWLLDLMERVKKAREMTIYTLMPFIAGYKYVPFTLNVDINASLIIKKPGISTYKTGCFEVSVSQPGFIITAPMITGAHG